MATYLEMKGIDKTFSNGVHALNNAGLEVKKGEIHALIGENAAGKSTLMNILYGTVAPDAGEIYLNGELKHISHPSDAISLGIGMVHQHFMLVPDFTILENIVLGKEKQYTNAFRKIDFNKAREDVQKILDKIGVELDLDARMDTVSIGLQSKVEIVKALFRGAELLILDEPTTVLAPNEVDSFFDFLRSLRDAGCTMIYISHRMKEIFDLTDRITVMRKGERIKTVETGKTFMEEIATLMLGYEAQKLDYDDTNVTSTENMLEVEKLKVKNGNISLNDVSFHVRKGEVLGIAGIEGNGQVELADALIGLLPAESGRIILNGEDISGQATKQRREKKLAYVTDDRMKKGLGVNARITENCIMGHEDESFIAGKFSMIDGEKARKFANEVSENYKVEGLRSPDQKIRSLSGGNMQKVLVGRELITKPELTILAQPTVGIDFNAQRIIHERVKELQKEGCSFLLISEDVDELLHLSNRILVMYRGEIVKEFSSRDEFDSNEIGYYMIGMKKA